MMLKSPVFKSLLFFSLLLIFSKQVISQGFSYISHEKKITHILGLNPILKIGEKGEWDEFAIECSEIYKEKDKYFLVYHSAKDGHYRIGAAYAKNPIGPWIKYEKNPVLDVGEIGSWDDRHVACAAIIKENNKYLIWYSANKTNQYPRWDIGLATADSILSPWTKYSANPILEDFGYLGSVLKINDKYKMYSLYPVNSTSLDSGPIVLANSNSPEGPWQKLEDNPVIDKGEFGAWDDGGFSEAGVIFENEIYETFYGGINKQSVKIENMGYAYSVNGVNFVKNLLPIAKLESNPNISAFSEVHTLYEYPFYYTYHTTRYYDNPSIEDIGIQIFTSENSGYIDVPILNLPEIIAGQSTVLSECPTINLVNSQIISLIIQYTLNHISRSSIGIKIFYSEDGVNFMEDLSNSFIITNEDKSENKIEKIINTSKKCLKLVVQNHDILNNIVDMNINVKLFFGAKISSIDRNDDHNNPKVSFYSYPNPFNNSTTIHYDIEKDSNVRLDIYTILGQKIETLINAFHEKGRYILNYEGINLSSGIYFAFLQTGEISKSIKLLLIK